MKLMTTIILSLFVSIATFANNGDPVTKSINLEESQVSWVGYKIGGKHTGTVPITSGGLEFDGDILTGGSFVLDMTSLNCTDLEGNTKAKLEGHLKSEDFFGVEKHPSATINITRVISRGVPGDYKVIADLTIKDTTKPIKFNVITEEGVLKADLSIDRSEYDVKYGSGSFFDKLGDNTIYDEFDVSVAIVPQR